MTFVRGVGAVLLRVAVITGLYLAYVALIDGSDSTDALGAGLLFFLIVGVVTLVWAGADGVRGGLLRTAIVWILVAPLAGLVIVAHADGLADLRMVLEGVVFFGLLWFVPALVGGSAGALAHRNRGSAVV